MEYLQSFSKLSLFSFAYLFLIIDLVKGWDHNILQLTFCTIRLIPIIKPAYAKMPDIEIDL